MYRTDQKGAFHLTAHHRPPPCAKGFEARGLIFGAPLALKLKVPFVPLRKPGKLPGKNLKRTPSRAHQSPLTAAPFFSPGETIYADYITEYSTDRIEMHLGAIQAGQRVVLIDDLVATGGTLAAGIELVKKAGGEVVSCGCVIELPELNGREKLGGIPLFILVEKEDTA
jgi:adenine phosphoribosyltransferase